MLDWLLSFVAAVAVVVVAVLFAYWVLPLVMFLWR